MQFLCWEGRNLEFPRGYFVRFSYLNLILPHYVSLRWEKRGDGGRYVLDCFSSWMSLGDVGGSIKMLAG